MPTTSEPDIAVIFRDKGPNWSNGSDTGGQYSSKRIKRLVDQINASDVNELRDVIDLLITHTHQHEDSSC